MSRAQGGDNGRISDRREEGANEPAQCAKRFEHRILNIERPEMLVEGKEDGLHCH